MFLGFDEEKQSDGDSYGYLCENPKVSNSNAHFSLSKNAQSMGKILNIIEMILLTHRKEVHLARTKIAHQKICVT